VTLTSMNPPWGLPQWETSSRGPTIGPRQFPGLATVPVRSCRQDRSAGNNGSPLQRVFRWHRVGLTGDTFDDDSSSCARPESDPTMRSTLRRRGRAGRAGGVRPVATLPMGAGRRGGGVDGAGSGRRGRGRPAGQRSSVMTPSSLEPEAAGAASGGPDGDGLERPFGAAEDLATSDTGQSSQIEQRHGPGPGEGQLPHRRPKSLPPRTDRLVGRSRRRRARPWSRRRGVGPATWPDSGAPPATTPPGARKPTTLAQRCGAAGTPPESSPRRAPQWPGQA